MARSNPLIPSMNAGELSPRLHARTDFAKYPAGMETCQNLVCLPEGGVMRRAGTRYVAEAKSSAVKGRLKPFQFSTAQAYMLELGDNVMRFYRHQGQIVAADTDAAITNGDFTSDITGWDDVSTGSNGAEITHDSTNGRLSLDPSGTASDDIAIAEQDVTTTETDTEHVIKFRVIGAPGDKIELQVGTATGGSQILSAVEKEVGYHCVAFTPTASPFYVQFRNKGSFRNKIVQIDDVEILDDQGVEIDTPWPEADLFNVEGPQSADVLYLFHHDYPTHKLQRFGHTTWSLVEVAWADGPYLDENATSTTLTASAATGLGVTLTASSVAGINGGEGFQATDVGRLVRLTDGTTKNWGWGVIVSRSSTTVVTVDIRRTFTVTTAETSWALGAWSGTTGYPSVGAFFEQRIFAAGTDDQPQTFWASNTGDFENMAPDSANSSGAWDGTVEDDDGLNYTISADDVNAIRWLSPGEDTLAIGTVGGEWTPSSQGAVLTPTDITVRQQTSHGSAQVQPVRVGNVVLFAQRAKRKVREFGFAFEIDGFQAPDMTRLAQHITKGGITEMAFAEEPNSLVWAVRGNGVLLSMTYRREEDVVGWARSIIGGSFGTGHAVAESVAVIPGADGDGQVQSSEGRDEVWVIVKRTINESTKRYIEVMEGDFEGPLPNEYDNEDDWTAAMLEAQKDAYYADSIITYDGSATTSITGLDHLEGETVKVWADGAIADDKVVSGGEITLDAEASVVQIGLGYTHKGKSLKIEAGAVAGTAQGKKKRIHEIMFHLLWSHTLNFGADTDTLEMRDFRRVQDDTDSAVTLFTGEAVYEFGGKWTTDARIIWESDDPAPFALLAMAPKVITQDVK